MKARVYPTLEAHLPGSAACAVHAPHTAKEFRQSGPEVVGSTSRTAVGFAASTNSVKAEQSAVVKALKARQKPPAPFKNRGDVSSYLYIDRWMCEPIAWRTSTRLGSCGQPANSKVEAAEGLSAAEGQAKESGGSASGSQEQRAEPLKKAVEPEKQPVAASMGFSATLGFNIDCS